MYTALSVSAAYLVLCGLEYSSCCLFVIVVAGRPSSPFFFELHPAARLSIGNRRRSSKCISCSFSCSLADSRQNGNSQSQKVSSSRKAVLTSLLSRSDHLLFTMILNTLTLSPLTVLTWKLEAGPSRSNAWLFCGVTSPAPAMSISSCAACLAAYFILSLGPFYRWLHRWLLVAATLLPVLSFGHFLAATKIWDTTISTGQATSKEILTQYA